MWNEQPPLTRCTPTPGQTAAGAPAAGRAHGMWCKQDVSVRGRSHRAGRQQAVHGPSDALVPLHQHPAPSNPPNCPTSSSFSSYEAGMPCSLVIQPRTAFFPAMSGGSEVTCGQELGGPHRAHHPSSPAGTGRWRGLQGPAVAAARHAANRRCQPLQPPPRLAPPSAAQQLRCWRLPLPSPPHPPSSWL